MSNTQHHRSLPQGEWLEYAGDYGVEAIGGWPLLTVFLRNGYLYLRFGQQPGIKLHPWRPGEFFTADGRRVRFSGTRMLFGNIATVKCRPN
jgi:hypothetical protein